MVVEGECIYPVFDRYWRPGGEALTAVVSHRRNYSVGGHQKESSSFISSVSLTDGGRFEGGGGRPEGSKGTTDDGAREIRCRETSGHCDWKPLLDPSSASRDFVGAKWYRVNSGPLVITKSREVVDNLRIEEKLNAGN